MYAAPFDYFRAGSIQEAVQLLQRHPGAKLLAGGHSLIPLLKLRLASPAALIDIGRIAELRGIRVNGGRVRIGALMTHAELAASDALKTACPVLSEAAAQIGDPPVRNCGTLGGNVVHADPGSDLPTVLSALDARFDAAGPNGQRTIACEDFFQGMMTTALEEHEILTDVEVAARTPGEGMAYAKFVHTASRYAVVAAAAVVGVKDGMCTAARVAVGGLVPVAARARSVERALTGMRVSPDAIAAAARQVVGDLGDEILGDFYASADYRRAMAPVFVKRALVAAFERAA